MLMATIIKRIVVVIIVLLMIQAAVNGWRKWVADRLFKLLISDS